MKPTFSPSSVRPLKTLRYGAILALLIATGCSNCQRKPPAPKLEDAPELAQPAVEEPKEDETEKIIQSIITNCEIPATNRIKNCQNGEYDTFVEHVRSRGILIIPSTTEALLSQDLRKQRVAAQILRDFIPTILHTVDPGQLSEGDVRALLAKLQEQDPRTSKFALDIARPVLALTSVMGLEEEARNTIKQFDPSIDKATMWLHLQAMKGYVLHARLGGFDLVKATADDERPEMQIAAVEAVFDIPHWSEEEEARFCAWGAEMVAKEGADKLKGKPAELLLRCDRDTWHKALLEEGERREKNLTYGRPFADNYRFVCPKSSKVDERSDELCTRQYKMLMRVAKNDKFSEDERKFAIAMLSDRWLDDKTVEDLDVLINDPNAEVSKLATRMKNDVQSRMKAIQKAKEDKANGNYTPPPRGKGEGG